MFWNAVIKTVNVTMVFGVPPIVTFAVMVRAWANALAAGMCWAAIPAQRQRSACALDAECVESVQVPYELNNIGGKEAPFITPQTAFTLLSLFNVLRFPLVVLPKALRCVSEAIQATGVRAASSAAAAGSEQQCS